MARTAHELVSALWGDLTPGAQVGSLITDPELIDRARNLIDPDAEILFPAPDGGFLGSMRGPWRGADGLRDAWTEWLSGFDEWTNRIGQVEEPSDERVLMVVECRVRLAGSSSPTDVRAAALYFAHNERIVKIEHFLDIDQAHRAAGLA